MLTYIFSLVQDQLFILERELAHIDHIFQISIEHQMSCARFYE